MERDIGLSIDAKVGMLERGLAPNILCISETWMLNTRGGIRVIVFDMECLKRAIGMNVMVRINNINIREKCGYGRCLLERVDKSVLVVRTYEGDR